MELASKTKYLPKPIAVIVVLWAFLMMSLNSCVQAPKSSRKTTASGQALGQGSDTPTAPDFTNQTDDAYWWTNKKIAGKITLNQNTATNIYLRGKSVHSFLNSNNKYQSIYCMVASYSDSGLKKNLRIRAVPIVFNNPSTGTIERVLRIDIPESGQNSSTCLGTAYQISSAGIPDAATVGTADSAFDLPGLCTDCSGILESNNIALYSVTVGVGITTLDYITNSSLNLSGVGLRIDAKSNSTDESGTCSASSCQAKNFDCCLSGQCVKDGQTKPNASSEADYAQAIADQANDYLSFLRYPHIFFICPQRPIPTPTATIPPDAGATADAALEQKKIYYYCLEEAKKAVPDFAGQGVCPPTQDQTAFEANRKAVWSMCGCRADPFPTDPEDSRCPDYGLTATTNSSGIITAVDCVFPPPIADPTPFQSINISVPARSAPHLFYRSDTNAKVDDITSLASTVTQEGDDFFYLDPGSKSDPLSSEYSMNAVLGKMSVELNQALPATLLNIELDQVYIITTTQGLYTPCYQCDRDAWYKSFTAFPTITQLSPPGGGLQAVGYTTSRDGYQGNATYGNYEDTLFGRACWVPPTMIPFSHKKNGSLATQRLNRLKTQAAYFINGYQRDWFGFNKGALIGSFDGVTWFSVGNARRVQSTSKKLYLAINAPFADLADPSNFLVNVVIDQGSDSASLYDFDPQLALNHPEQNVGGTCRAYHQCNVDSDCVTKLGWEYSCLDINDYKTYWPQFDSNGDEKTNIETSLSYAQIIQGNLPPSSTKRCVYRGAGAPCKKNYSSLDNAYNNKARQFTCAPNFYCAGLGEASFNTRTVRTPSNLSFLLFGQEANILGRPLDYVLASNSLDVTITGNIENNATLHTAATGDWGICRPGKALLSTHLSQHQSKDGAGRTDYISQVGSCDGDETSDDRVSSCPAIETETGQNNAVGNFITNITALSKRHKQNACGAESLRLVGGVYENVFKAIELEPLATITEIAGPSLAKDACFRRAGAACHTNLECSPNKLHADQAVFFDIDAFGGTEAEKKYWEEYLICGQADPIPAVNSDDYNTYSLAKNKCCRELGRDISMFSEITAYVDGDETIFPEYGTDNSGLDADKFAYLAPNASGRYSRFSVAAPVSGNSASAVPYAETPAIQKNQTPKAYQWKTINDTGSGTCCGGGWVRKFSDGTHDWTKRDRLNIDSSNFECINYQTTLAQTRPDEIDSDNYGKDLGKVCVAPGDAIGADADGNNSGGCLQVAIDAASGLTIRNPKNLTVTTATIDTSPNVVDGLLVQNQLSSVAPYYPSPYRNITPISNQGPYNYFASHDYHYAASFYLPIFIGGMANINSVTIKYYDQDGFLVSTAAAALNGGCNIVSNPQNNLAANEYCIADDQTGLFDIFHAKSDNGFAWTYAGIAINFDIMNRSSYNPAPAAADLAMKGGNDLYYLTKLGRLELLGVPQIFYEPLYCNSSRGQLVPGIYDLPTDTRTDFEAAGFNYSSAVNGKNLGQIYDSAAALDTVANNLNEIVFQDQVALTPVFSGSEYTCCAKLGQKVLNASKCCSSYAETNSAGKLTCLIPNGTDLSVYFNKFISSEGTGDNLTVDPLLDTDFIPETGEPKLTSSVNTKIINLGRTYCASGQVRRGAAFGNFYAEPFAGSYNQYNQDEYASRYYGLVDSGQDFENLKPELGIYNTRGNFPYSQGFRWNHHHYCDDPPLP